MECDDEIFLLSLIYVDRWLAYHPKVPITYLNVHRLIASSLLIAIKYQQDSIQVLSNGFYASTFGLTLQGNYSFKCMFIKALNTQKTNTDMNRLELHFLWGVQFDLSVTDQQVHYLFLA